MSVRTTADEKIDSAKESFDSAVKCLKEGLDKMEKRQLHLTKLEIYFAEELLKSEQARIALIMSDSKELIDVICTIQDFLNNKV